MAIHAGQAPDPTTGSRAVPIYQTTSYVFRDSAHAANLFALKELGNIYTRIMNPTTAVFEERVAAIEGGTGALAVSSGQAAATLALLAITQLGDEIVAANKPLRRDLSIIEPHVPEARQNDPVPRTPGTRRPSDRPSPTRHALSMPKRSAIRSSTCPIFEKIAAIAHEAGIPFVVDNTVGVGLVRPLDYGADHPDHLGHEIHRRTRHDDRRRHRGRRHIQLGQTASFPSSRSPTRATTA